MSARAPQDPHLRLGITELGLLDETSFLGPEVLPGAARLTVALWLCAESPVSTQVVASASNRSIEHDGWTVYLADGEIAFRCKGAGGPCVEIAAVIEDDGLWHHVVATADLVAASLFVLIRDWECVCGTDNRRRN